ncbi:MAG: ribokinase [Maritimibacter sp.]|nr:ribokinase [Maritimibacter sp.]
MAVAVVVGSLHYDIFVDAPHRPAAGETVTARAWSPKFGGKGGNQAVALAGQGCDVRMVSAVGDDDFAPFLLDRLAAGGVSAEYVARVAGTGSGMSVAIGDDAGDYAAAIVSGANLAIAPAVVADPALWNDAAFLLLQNEVPEAVNLAAATAARAHGARVCLNAAPMRAMPDALLALVDILVVNQPEAEAICGAPVGSLEEALAAARALTGRVPAAVVTAGGAGVAFASAEASGVVPGVPVRAVSAHGAGDHFIGALVAALMRGAPLSDAAATANAAAARHVAGG